MNTKKYKGGTKKKLKKGRGKVKFSDSTEKNDNHGKVLPGQGTKTKRNASSLYSSRRASKNMEATIRAFNSAKMINSSSPLMDALTEDVKTVFQSNLKKKAVSDIISKKDLNLKELKLLNNFASKTMRQKIPLKTVLKATRSLKEKLN
tara:strand:- start:25262 stop:25705 length:444 start_codon:yes stop_codon:yes gene_type:complete